MYCLMLSKEMGSMKILIVSAGGTGGFIVLCIYGSGELLNQLGNGS